LLGDFLNAWWAGIGNLAGGEEEKSPAAGRGSLQWCDTRSLISSRDGRELT
jgi:hypothetical protein